MSAGLNSEEEEVVDKSGRRGGGWRVDAREKLISFSPFVFFFAVVCLFVIFLFIFFARASDWRPKREFE